MSSLCAVHPFRRRPARDDDVAVVDARVAVGAVCQGMLEEILVVAFGEIGALMAAARFAPGQGAEGDGFGGIEQEAHLNGRRQLGIEAVALVGDGDLCKVLFQLDRKSTRLNSSHLGISYAVFCLKKKNNTTYN